MTPPPPRRSRRGGALSSTAQPAHIPQATRLHTTPSLGDAHAANARPALAISPIGSGWRSALCRPLPPCPLPAAIKPDRVGMTSAEGRPIFAQVPAHSGDRDSPHNPTAQITAATHGACPGRRSCRNGGARGPRARPRRRAWSPSTSCGRRCRNGPRPHARRARRRGAGPSAGGRRTTSRRCHAAALRCRAPTRAARRSCRRCGGKAATPKRPPTVRWPRPASAKQGSAPTCARGPCNRSGGGPWRWPAQSSRQP
mmetsp:Transcript_4796/g.13298  ORF Transcript_4796/g.13298 Transcript_4796/m.13298 type:complete len:255 (-) Transcript_4796:1024-1788(-)